VVCLQVKLCDPHLSALEVRFSRRGAIQIYLYLLQLTTHYLLHNGRYTTNVQPLPFYVNICVCLDVLLAKRLGGAECRSDVSRRSQDFLPDVEMSVELGHVVYGGRHGRSAAQRLVAEYHRRQAVPRHR